MARSADDTVKRLGRVEAALGNIATILVDQSERIDGVQAELRSTREALAERLDRLIAVTTSERTASFERLAEIERRLARLEDRAGI